MLKERRTGAHLPAAPFHPHIQLYLSTCAQRSHDQDPTFAVSDCIQNLCTYACMCTGFSANVQLNTWVSEVGSADTFENSVKL